MTCTTLEEAIIQPVTFETILRARKLLDGIKKPYTRMEVCKKHYNGLLADARFSYLTEPDIVNGALGYIGSIKVYIRPYIKKARFYKD